MPIQPSVPLSFHRARQVNLALFLTRTCSLLPHRLAATTEALSTMGKHRKGFTHQDRCRKGLTHQDSTHQDSTHKDSTHQDSTHQDSTPQYSTPLDSTSNTHR